MVIAFNDSWIEQYQTEIDQIGAIIRMFLWIISIAQHGWL